MAWSCATHTVKLVRYKQVDVVRVPQSAVEAFRQYNKEKCDSDALMPKFSSVMRFGCLTKTHFCHANKLSKDGNRTLFNEGRFLSRSTTTGGRARRFEKRECLPAFTARGFGTIPRRWRR